MALKTIKLYEVAAVLIWVLFCILLVFFFLVDVTNISQQFRLRGFLSEPVGGENVLKYIKHYQKSVS